MKSQFYKFGFKVKLLIIIQNNKPNGFKDIAKNTVIMSIKKFDYIDESCKEILF